MISSFASITASFTRVCFNVNQRMVETKHADMSVCTIQISTHNAAQPFGQFR